MRTNHLVLLLACCLPIAAVGAGVDPHGSVDSRVAAQNALFEEYYQSELETHP
jgi:hypothetical protein